MLKPMKHKRRVFPYWKIQVWDAATLAWRDIQRAYYVESEAWAACPAGGRLMLVTREGRTPVL